MIFNMDCVDGMSLCQNDSIDICITSPPYNLGIKYSQYGDNKPYDEYLQWMNRVFREVKRILKPSGHFFLNVGYSNVQPWIAMDVANEARRYFTLQNNIAWVKSIHTDQSYGNFKPIVSERFLSPTWENLFHFTHDGLVVCNKSAIGVKHKYSSDRGGPNCPVKRFKGRLVKRLGYKGVRDFEKNATQEEKDNVNEQVDKKDKETPESKLRDRGNSWFVPYDTIQNKEEKGNHPAIFPEELVANCIKLSKMETGVVLDPFLGTGTTAYVAKQLGFSYLGYELDTNYFNYAKERLSDDC